MLLGEKTYLKDVWMVKGSNFVNQFYIEPIRVPLDFRVLDTSHF